MLFSCSLGADQPERNRLSSRKRPSLYRAFGRLRIFLLRSRYSDETLQFLQQRWKVRSLQTASDRIHHIARSHSHCGIKEAGILVCYTLEIVLSESIPLFQITDCGTKRPSRHERIVE